MQQNLQERRRYPSDLNERQWNAAAPWIPTPQRGRRRQIDVREVVNAVNYRWTTGCAWRMLPHDFPSWKTVYTYVRRWGRDGTLTRIRDAVVRRQAEAKRANESMSTSTALGHANHRH